MYELKENLIYTGHVKRTSAKGNIYTIVNFLSREGQTFGVILECDLPVDLQQLDKVKAVLGLEVGQYMQLKLLSCVKL